MKIFIAGDHLQLSEFKNKIKHRLVSYYYSSNERSLFRELGLNKENQNENKKKKTSKRTRKNISRDRHK